MGNEECEQRTGEEAVVLRLEKVGVKIREGWKYKVYSPWGDRAPGGIDTKWL